MNNQTELFELLPCTIDNIFCDQDYIVSLEIEKEFYTVNLNAYEGTVLTFAESGCSDNAHINTIYQVLLKFKQSAGFSLERVIIEAKFGDVFYCRLHWKHEKGDIYNVVSLGDGLILSILAEAEIFIAKFVVLELEKITENTYIQSYEVQEFQGDDEDDDEV